MPTVGREDGVDVNGGTATGRVADVGYAISPTTREVSGTSRVERVDALIA